ncbi:MAG: hypothetical protein N2F24_17000 [Deltaproteobacteria bacterium]|jgi:hypothetical protein|nr:hypothetical protein [Verrucomicrobiota bacterium]|tara:strand:+ start:2155 stop:2859 length:705 start_codon:yes stop_codon:yes gene_type:complete
MPKNEEEKPKGGCLGKLFGLIVFLVIVGLGAAFFFISKPQDFSDLGGNAPMATTPTSPPRDMEAVLMKSIEGDYSVVLTEKELNEWLGRELKLKQTGELAKWVSMKRVWVRLREDVAEIIIEREISGKPFTTSMFLKIEQIESAEGISTQIHLHGGGFHDFVPFPTRGGRFGQLTVPQGFLIMVMPEFQKIASLFEREIDLGFQQMARIKIKDKKIELDPQPPTRSAEKGDISF